MEKHRFTLVAPKAEFQAFAGKCQSLGLSQTEVLRSFMRGYTGIESPEFVVVPVTKMLWVAKVKGEDGG